MYRTTLVLMIVANLGGAVDAQTRTIDFTRDAIVSSGHGREPTRSCP